jgi:hypothetical protein
VAWHRHVQASPTDGGASCPIWQEGENVDKGRKGQPGANAQNAARRLVPGGLSRSARAVVRIVMGVRLGDFAPEAGRLPSSECHHADME